jgi:hypothetical protein
MRKNIFKIAGWGFLFAICTICICLNILFLLEKKDSTLKVLEPQGESSRNEQRLERKIRLELQKVLGDDAIDVDVEIERVSRDGF